MKNHLTNLQNHIKILNVLTKSHNDGGCSVVVNAPVCGTGDRGFKSHLPPHIFSNMVKK